MALVVPSNREGELRTFLSAWAEPIKAAGVRAYVVEDGPERSFDLGPDGSVARHLSWANAPDALLAAIDTRSPSCRHIGIAAAYDDGADLIITLDDDVRPMDGPEGDVFGTFGQVLTTGIPVWLDPLLNYRSRGYPLKSSKTIPIDFHVGGFSGVPDVDGETQLREQVRFETDPPRYQERLTLVPPQQLIPVNGGICGWTRRMTPYVHWTLWCSESGYRRFDDIWMGVMVKRLLDRCGMHMSYGPPLVRHIRASSAEQNVRLEATGRVWNEQFWSLLDEGLDATLGPANRAAPLGEEGLDRIFEGIASCLGAMDDRWAIREAVAMRRWRELFRI